jgi:hypothetical protein
MTQTGTGMTDYSDAIVAEYLRRLDIAASPLPPDRRTELVVEIGEHIAYARASGQAGDEAALRELLDRLGDPHDIVAEAREDPPTDPAGYPRPGAYGPPPDAFGAPPQHFRKPRIGLEITAVILMTIGSIIPLLGWLAGAVLLWASRRFTIGEKLLATLVVPGGPFVALYVLGIDSQSCSASSLTDSAGNTIQGPTTCTGFALPTWLGLPVLVVAVVAPFVVAGILLRRAGGRAALEPPVPVFGPPPVSGPSRWGALEVAAVLLLGIGGFILPLVGPVAGLVCAWLSSAWTTTEKWVATGVAALALLVPLLGLLAVRL